MQWVLAYDVSSNSRRRRIANCLEELGFRRQKSVFEGNLSTQDVSMLIDRLTQFLNPETDSITAWPVATHLSVGILHAGKPREQAERAWCIL